MKPRLLVTGATGYIGRAFVDRAIESGADVLALARRKPDPKLPCPFIIPSDWHDETLLAKAVEGRDAVVHLAGLAHKRPGDMAAINRDLPVMLARACAKAGMPRFVFVSTAAVFGGSGTFTVEDTPHPETPYGIAKLEAEQALCALLDGTPTRLHIVRAPVVIGPNAPGHAEAIRRHADRILPFGNLSSMRSFIDIDDMVQFLYDLAIDADEPASLWHVGTSAVTATDLIKRMAKQDGIEPKLFPFPEFLLKMAKVDRFRPLVESHVLKAGRIELDRLV